MGEPLSDEKLATLTQEITRAIETGEGSVQENRALAALDELLDEIALGRAATRALAVLQEALPPLRDESERLRTENEQQRENLTLYRRALANMIDVRDASVRALSGERDSLWEVGRQLIRENAELRTIVRVVAAIRETGMLDTSAPYDAQISALTIQQARAILAAYTPKSESEDTE